MLGQSVHNFVFSAFGTVSSLVLGFLFAGLSIRFLGEARAGYLMLLQSLIGLQAALGGFGLGVPAVRRIAILHKNAEFSQARTIAGSVVAVNLTTGVVVALLLISLFPKVFVWSRLERGYRPDAFLATVLIGITFLLSQWASAWQTVYQALQRYDLLTGFATTFGMLNGLIGILVLSRAPSLTAAAAVSLGMATLQLGVGAFFTKRLLHGTPWYGWSWREVRPMLSFGGWTYLGGIGNTLFMNMDRLVLTTFLGSAALPYYALPQRIFAQIHSALTSYFQFLFPMLGSLGDGATQAIENLDDRLRWFVAMLSGAAYTGLALLGPTLLAHLVSRDFADRANIPLLLVCVQGFVHAQNIVPYYTSWAAGQGRPNAVMALFHGLLVISTAVVLIPKLGYVGASLAQLWILVIVIVHSIWVCRILSRQRLSWRWLSWLVSPCVMIGVWFLVVKGLAPVLPNHAVSLFCLTLVGALAGVGAVSYVERLVFPAQRRWRTLTRAFQLLSELLKRRVLAK